MIIDVSRIDQVVVDTENMRAYIGGGANFGKINAVLNSYKVHMPGGACDEVTIGGYLQCGGYGETSLMFGMNCDVLLEALVMLYDGSLVIANAETNADLFWALRGGTGNNFGVLLQATYQLFDLYECWGFGLSWDVENIGSAMEALQRQYSGENTPENLGYQCTISFVEERPCLIFRGIVRGTQEDCQRLMQPLLGVEGARLDITPYQGSYSELDDSLNSNPSVPDVTIHTRTVANSRYIQRQLTAAEWQEFGELILQSPNLTKFLGIEPYGGKINSVQKTDTAFIHRDVCFDIYIWVFWNDEEEEATSRVHLQQFMALMDKYSNGHSYQGYPNRDNADYRQLYWGESFNTLLAIKKKYDPIGLFTFEQAVAEIPGDAGDEITRPGGDVLVDVSDDIVYASFN
jgi:FAD/FMN-containing dehydrogenase